MKEATALVIGTGAGGLAAAGYLARAGYRVVAIEQGAHAGGNLGPFEREGFIFDTGLHYIGQCRPGQLVYETLGGLGIDAAELFREIEPEGFDIYRFPGLEVKNCRGGEAFLGRLRARFPSEEHGLGQVFELVRAVGDLQGLGGRKPRLEDLSLLVEVPALLRFAGGTFGDLLSHWIDDPAARAVLAAPCGDYGLPPSRASALAGLGILAHYADGAFYPKGGSGALRDALVGAATRQGATIRTGARVHAIRCEAGRAIGVELEGGERIRGDIVISDVDPTTTFERFLGSEALPRRLRKKVEHVEPSLGAFVVHLGLRRDLSAHGLSASNLWLYPRTDIDAIYEPLFRGELPDELALFVSSGSLKEAGGRLAPPGCSTLDIMTFIPERIFAPWDSMRAQDRGPGYHDAKERLANRVLAEFERALPGVVNNIAVREISTPLTWADYLGAPHGGAYGPAATPHQSGPWRFGTHTPVAGLFLAGQGVFGNGVAPSLMSGRMAAMAAQRHLSG